MKCSYCEREIKENEKFYEIEDEFYCDDCVEERTATYYVVDGDTYEERDDVGCYTNIHEYIDYLNIQIKMYQEDLEYYSKRSDEFSVKRTEKLRKKIQKLEEKKAVIEGDEE